MKTSAVSKTNEQIGDLINPPLVEPAKKQSGIEGDSANLVDAFPEAFKSARGKVDPELNLEF